jgi:hypothetical protein
MAEMRADAADVRDDTGLNRDEASGAGGGLRERVSDTLGTVRARVDLAQFARDNPWVALGVACGAGLLLSATGADRRAASATARATRRATSATADATKRAAAATASAARHAADAVRGGQD